MPPGVENILPKAPPVRPSPVSREPAAPPESRFDDVLEKAQRRPEPADPTIASPEENPKQQPVDDEIDAPAEQAVDGSSTTKVKDGGKNQIKNRNKRVSKNGAVASTVMPKITVDPKSVPKGQPSEESDAAATEEPLVSAIATVVDPSAAPAGQQAGGIRSPKVDAKIEKTPATVVKQATPIVTNSTAEVSPEQASETKPEESRPAVAVTQPIAQAVNSQIATDPQVVAAVEPQAVVAEAAEEQPDEKPATAQELVERILKEATPQKNPSIEKPLTQTARVAAKPQSAAAHPHDKPVQPIGSDSQQQPPADDSLPQQKQPSIVTPQVAAGGKSAEPAGKIGDEQATAKPDAPPPVLLDAPPAKLSAEVAVKQFKLPTAPALPPEAQFAADNHASIVTSVKTELLPNGGTMHLRLDPPELGALEVSVKMRDGMMTASFQTSNDEATKLLTQSMTQLKTALESQGINVDKIHVQQAPRDANTQQNDGHHQQNQSLADENAARQDRQRKEMLQRMWQRLSIGHDPLDMVA